jgi:hypothetical protein
MCGDEDPSEHLGINLSTGDWGCHRDQSHRGKSGAYLIRALLGCSISQAKHIVKQYTHNDPDTLDEALTALLDEEGEAGPEEPKDNTKLVMQYLEFRHIKNRGSTKRFYDYLESRNMHKLIERYELRCALTGRYQDRVIIPVRQNGKLLGFTSRAITNPKHAPRYLASSSDLKAAIFDYDNVKLGGGALFITEGPFDAMRINDNSGVKATCTFGTSVTIPQIALLRAVAKKYTNVWVLFDEGADGPGAELASWIGAKQAFLPWGIKDPGELTAEDLRDMRDPEFDGSFDWVILKKINKSYKWP